MDLFLYGINPFFSAKSHVFIATFYSDFTRSLKNTQIFQYGGRYFTDKRGVGVLI